MLLSIVSFIIVFTLLATVHEAGHYIWAKRAGIRVFEFGFGFGPRLFSLERNGTIFSLNLIPILAFVRIAGEGEAEDDLACPDNELFYNKTPAQKAKTLLAGPLGNILCAFIILVFLFALAGIPSGVSREIASVVPGSPAEHSGIKVGDVLLSINGRSYSQMEEAVDFIHSVKNQPLTLTLQRGKDKIEVKATPKYNAQLKLSLLGFTPKPVYQSVNFFLAVYHAAVQTFSMIVLTLIIIGRLLSGAVRLTDLAGPVGIAQVTGRYAQSGLISLVAFAAFLNVNVGVLNLLPLPALDGGHLTFVLIEWLRRKPLDRQLVNKINSWGMLALLTLMALVTLNDILRVFGRS